MFYQIKANYFANAGGAANESLGFPLNTTLGNLTFLVVGWESGVTITSVTSTLGETVHSLPAIVGPTHSCQAFYVLSAAAGGNGFRANFSGGGGTFVQMIIAEYEMNGVTTALTFHAEQTGTVQNCSSPSITTTDALSILIGYADGIASTSSVTSPWNLETASTGLRSGLEDQTAAAGTFNAAIANSTIPGGGWECGIAAFTVALAATPSGQQQISV